MLSKSFFVWLLAALIGLPASAQEAVRSLAGISEYRLDNGLQVLLMPVPGSGRSFVTVTYRVGSRMEGPGEAGMAHLLEHVTFRGTRDAQGQLIDLGAELRKISPGSNAHTTFDQTNYTADFPPEAGLLARVLMLEAERMQHARLAQEDFDKEKPIVLNEMGMRGEGLARQLVEGLGQGAFAHHPYRLPVIGTVADIEQLQLGTLRAFYEKFYRPDNAVLMIAGEFDVPQALAAVQASFGPLKAPATPVPVLELSEPAQTEPRLVTLRSRQTAMALGYRIPGLSDPRAAALMVWTQMMPAISSPLTDDPANQGGSMLFWQPSRDPFLAAAGLALAKVKSGNAEARENLAAKALRWAEAMESARFVSDADLRRLTIAIERARSQWGQGLRAPGPASTLISAAVGAGDWRLALRMLDDLQRLTPTDVARAADAFVRARNRTLVLGVTDPAVRDVEVQEQPLSGLASWFSKPVQVENGKDAGLAEFKPATAQKGASAGEAYETDPAVLDSEVKRLKLPSGALLALLKRQSANDRVTVLLQMRGGPPQRMANEPGWRGLGLELLSAGSDGERRLNADQIAFFKAKVQAEYSVQSGPQGMTVSLTVPSDRLQVALQLLGELLRAPALPPQAFKDLKARTLARLTANRRAADWAPELARQHYMKSQGLQWGDAGYAHSTGELAEIWNKLDIDAVKAFWQRYWSANELRVSAVGPLPDTFPSMVEAYFGSWKKPDAPPFERYVPGYKPEEGARFVSRRKPGGEDGADESKASALVQFAQGFPLNGLDDEAMAMTVGARILAGGQISGSRLADRLRGQDALSYSVNYQLALPSWGEAARLSLSASAAPGQVLRVEAGLREEIDRLLKDGITQAELDGARRELLQTRRRGLSNDAALSLILISQFDRMESFAKLDERQLAALQALDVDKVNAALRRLLLPERWVVVITGAEAAAK